MQGKLIVIEGLDGCGKSTQLELLKDIYKEARFISFPNYDSASGAIIKDYLSGRFPEENGETGCYTASSFYAVDRYISYKTDWQSDYTDGKLIIAARYTSSNAIYQMTKLSQEKWDGYMDWLWDYEFNKFAIPKPDKVIFLDMPIEISQKLLTARYSGDESKKDIHEKNIGFLKSCRNAALYAAEKYNWTVVPCSDGEKPLRIETINEKLRDIINGLIC